MFDPSPKKSLCPEILSIFSFGVPYRHDLIYGHFVMWMYLHHFPFSIES